MTKSASYEVSREADDIRPEYDSPDTDRGSVAVDLRIAELARRQHGVVAQAQITALGLGPRAVRHRIATGRFVRLHRGVLAVGHGAVSANGRRLAAVLACGPRAVLSHRSAATLWMLRRYSGRHEVSVASQAGRAVAGVDVHRCRNLSPDDVTAVEGIPCTTVARTLLDLAATTDRQGLVAAIARAEELKIYDGSEIEAVLRRARGKRGTRLLRSVLAEWSEDHTRSHLERELLAFLRRHALPEPEMNAWITLENRTIQPDFMWREPRVILETDGYATHGTRKAFGEDRRRDRLLVRNGWTVLRVAYGQLDRDLERTLRRVLGV